MKAITEMLIAKKLARADVLLNGSRDWDITLRDTSALNRIAFMGSLGFGETYVDGQWDTPKLDQLIDKIYSSGIAGRKRALPYQYARVQQFFINQQTRRRSKKVGEEHYDLGNDFYEKMLCSRMMYTCAYWEGANNLEEAQEKKLDLICRKLQLQPGMRVLDLGCGWGGAAKYMAETYGVEVVAITISKEQASWGQSKAQGLPVDIRHGDYREIRQEKQMFDRVVSIGLMEHVGPKNYATLINLVKDKMVDDGLALIHTIGRKAEDKVTDPWFTRYIFPNGHIPSMGQISQAVSNTLVIEDVHNIGYHYDKTLMAWYDNFVAHWDQFKDQYPEHFFRMWEYYLLSSAGSFRSKHHQLWQIVLSGNAYQGYYQSVR